MAQDFDTPIWAKNFVVSDSGKILIPSNVRGGGSGGRSWGDPYVSDWMRSRFSLNEGDDELWQFEGFNHGLRLERDSKTLVIRWPEKGSGWDDKVSDAIANGEVANAGISPITHPQLTAILVNQQLQASQADIILTGRTSPVKKAKDAISRFNDSPIGFSAAAAQFLYQLRVYNRGAPISLIPLHYPLDRWPEYGMTMVPFKADSEDDGKKQDGDEEYFYLEVDWNRVGTPVPYLPNVFDLEATGNAQWPYWFCIEVDDKKRWVLLHNSQIIPIIPGVANGSELGTSSVYIVWNLLAERVLIEDRRTERQINAMSDGLLGIGGVDFEAGDLKARIAESANVDRGKGNILNKGYNVVTSTEKINFDEFSFRKDDGVSFEDRRAYEEDVIALAMGEPLVALVTRGGIGFGVNSPTAREAAADGGAYSILDILSIALGAIYSRVQVSATRPNDLAKRKKVETFRDWALGLKDLQASAEGGVLTVEEIRLILDRDIWDIPRVADEGVIEQATTDQDENRPGVNDGRTTPVSNPRDGEEDDERENQEGDQNPELSRLVKLARELFWTVLNLETLAGALKSEDFNALSELWQEAVTEQYKTADLQGVVDEWNEKGVDPDDDDEDVVLEVVANHVLPIDDNADEDAIYAALLVLAIMGRNQAIDDAPEDNRLSDEDTRSTTAQISSFLRSRIESLLRGDTDVDVAEGEFTDIVPGLDLQSYRDVASAAKLIMDEEEEITVDEALEALLLLGAGRGEFIAETEAANGYGYGRWYTSDRMEPTHKQWIASTAKNPRPEHMEHWGQVVEWDMEFDSGDTWAGQRPGCQCDTVALWLD